MGKSVLERQLEFKERQKRRGMTQVRVWVKKEDRQKLLEYVIRLREGRDESN